MLRGTITPASVTMRSSRRSCGSAGTLGTSCIGISKADRDDRVQLGEGGDGAVEMALAVAEAVAGAGRTRRAARAARFGKHSGASGPGSRTPKPPRTSTSPGRHSRQLNLGCRICDRATVWPRLHERAHDGTGIDLAADRPVAADRLHVPQLGESREPAGRCRAPPLGASRGRGRRAARKRPGATGP